MPAHRLTTLRVEKPWGRHDLWPGFEPGVAGAAPVGEIWFDSAPRTDSQLLVKYLFTSEKLSIQVHPGDDAARAAGYPRGKDEAWLILAADPESTIALGTREVTTREALAAGALDGSIVDMLHWRSVKAGDVIYSAAGTVHAIGAGITVIEVQQNVDLTYRLYDYGRPRELHLAQGIAVSDPIPFVDPLMPGDIGGGRAILCEGGKFVLERWSWDGARQIALPKGLTGWLVPVTGGGDIDGAPFTAGECWTVDGSTVIAPRTASDLLFAYPNPARVPLFC